MTVLCRLFLKEKNASNSWKFFYIPPQTINLPSMLRKLAFVCTTPSKFLPQKHMCLAREFYLPNGSTQQRDTHVQSNSTKVHCVWRTVVTKPWNQRCTENMQNPMFPSKYFKPVELCIQACSFLQGSPYHCAWAVWRWPVSRKSPPCWLRSAVWLSPPPCWARLITVAWISATSLLNSSLCWSSPCSFRRWFGARRRGPCAVRRGRAPCRCAGRSPAWCTYNWVSVWHASCRWLEILVNLVVNLVLLGHWSTYVVVHSHVVPCDATACTHWTPCEQDSLANGRLELQRKWREG